MSNTVREGYQFTVSYTTRSEKGINLLFGSYTTRSGKGINLLFGSIFGLSSTFMAVRIKNKEYHTVETVPKSI